MTRTIRAAGLAAALTLLPVAAASAHPSFNPNQVPAGESVAADLVVPHGCSTGDGVVPEEGEGVATVEFALQKTDGVTVAPADVEGWDVAEDVDAWVWTDAGGATTEPITFPVTLTVDGTEGGELALAAYQACEDGSSYRWTAGSEETPGVHLEVTAGEVGMADMDQGDHGDGDMSEAETGHSEDADGNMNLGIIAAIVAVALLLVAGLVAVARGKQAT